MRSPLRSPEVNMAAARRGGAALSPGRSGAGPPSAESLRRRRPLGARMEELRFGPSLGDRDGPALRSWRQPGSPGVIWRWGVGVGGGSCQKEAERNETEAAL